MITKQAFKDFALTRSKGLIFLFDYKVISQ